MKQLFKEIGAKVRKARKEKGLALRKFGELCNMDYSNICRFEQGNQDVRLSTIKIMADVLGKELKDFL